MAKLEDEPDLVDRRLPAGWQLRDVDQEVARRVVGELDGHLLVFGDGRCVADALPAVRRRIAGALVVVARVDGDGEAELGSCDAYVVVWLRLAGVDDEAGARAGGRPPGLGVVVVRLRGL